MRFSIETPRLMIREWADGDFIPFRTLATDPRVMRYIGRGAIWNDQQIHAFLWQQDQTSMAFDFCLGPMIDRVTDRMIGIGGLQRIGQLPAPAISWWIHPDLWGNGLATESGVGILGYAFTKAKLPRVVGIADPAQGGAIRVFEKLEMTFAGRFSGDDLGLAAADVLMYSLDNPLQSKQPVPVVATHG